MFRGLLFLLLFIALGACVNIDDFGLPNDGRQEIEYFFNPSSDTLPSEVFTSVRSDPTWSNRVIGGSRVLQLQMTEAITANGIQSFVGTRCPLCGTGALSLSSDAGITGRGVLIYDGSVEGEPFTGINPTGLGGLDFTEDGIHDVIAFQLREIDLDTRIIITAYTDAESISFVDFNAFQLTSLDNQTLLIPLASFVKRADAVNEVDFTNVGAFSIEIAERLEIDFSISSVFTRVLCDPPCENGGVCESPDVCQCPDDTFGDRCQNRTTECMCFHGGTCIDPDDPQSCNCTGTGYGGEWCAMPVCEPSCEESSAMLANIPEYIHQSAIQHACDHCTDCVVAPFFEDAGLKCVGPNTCSCPFSPSPFTGFWTGYDQSSCAGCKGDHWRMFVVPDRAAYSTLQSDSESGAVSIVGELRWCGNERNLPYFRFDFVHRDDDGVFTVHRGILRIHQTGNFQSMELAITKDPNTARPTRLEPSERVHYLHLTKRAARGQFEVTQEGVLILVPAL